MNTDSSYQNLVTLRPSFTQVLTYNNEEEAQRMIEDIAVRIASIYAAFLTLARHQNRSKELKFYGFP